MPKRAPISVNGKDRYLNPTEVAVLLGISAPTLGRMRADTTAKTKLPFVRIGKKAIKYRLSDVHAYIAARTER